MLCAGAAHGEALAAAALIVVACPDTSAAAFIFVFS